MTTPLAVNFANLSATTPRYADMSAREDAYMSDEDEPKARQQRRHQDAQRSESPEFNNTLFGECVYCGSGTHGRENCLQKYHAER